MRDSSIKVSILLAVYNVKNYLERCLDSILEQSYQNLEIIIVDDGSTDGSEIICDNYAKKDCRISVIHKTNGGLASARNEGIRHATGKYTLMLDSDDYILPQMVEILLDSIIDTKSDIVCCQYYTNYIDCSSVNKNVPEIERVLEKAEFMPAILRDQITSHVWNKLIKTDLLTGIVFPDRMVAQDIGVMHEIFYNAERVVIIRNQLYVYVLERPDNITNINNKNVRGALHRAKHFHKRYEFSLLHYPEVSDELLAKMLFFYRSAYIILSNGAQSQEISKKEIKDILNKYLYRILVNKNINLPMKIRYLLICFGFVGRSFKEKNNDN